MDYKPLPVGIDNFEKLVTRGYYFVDKTLFMKELLDKKGDVNLFTRPRRFGKTLNMSMLQYFFEDARDRDGNKAYNRYLFDSLAIMQAGEQYLAHMGQYPVINMTLKAGKRPTFEGAYTQIAWQIAMEYDRHSYVLGGNLSNADKAQYRRLMERKAGMEDYCTSLQFLSQCLEKYYGRKAIILIDEYDVPLENAFARGFYSEMVDFMRSLFESALKTNSSMEFAVITGCLRISKESIFTGMNNLEIISILSKNFDEYFGFTETEVAGICGDYNLEKRYDTIREWYNGYVFGDANVYNPWSVIRFIKDLKADENEFPSSYWANTSSNDIVRKLIERADDSVKAELEDLIDGKTVEKPIHEDITYDEVYKTVDNMWNFMFFTGYFRKVSERMDERTKEHFVELTIPNEEVRYIFRQKIMTWFREKMEARDMTALYTAFVNKDTDTVKEELDEIMLDTISSMDENESYYHGIVAGLLSPMKGYITKSNREGGKGRCDLFVKSVSRRKEAFVVEFKVAKKTKDLEKKADEALRQIEDRQYSRELYDEGYETVSSYGIAFCGKECMVKHRE